MTTAKASGRRPVTLREIQAQGRIRGTAGVLGPAFVASVAYVDPGNFATNFAGGAEQGYELVWVIVVANLMAMGVQYLTSKAGLATGQSLPELCRDRFSRRVNVLLWLQAEVVAMATDLAEFVGAAVGLNLVFGVPLFPADLITALVAFVILGLERRGYRRFELAIIALLALVGLGFLYVFIAVGGQHYPQIARGLLPHLTGGDGLRLTVGIIGATVMPHIVYLHSALHKDRIRTASCRERRTLLTLSKWDCITGLGIAGVVNLSMLCIAAALFHKRARPRTPRHAGWRRSRAGLRDRLDGLGPVVVQRGNLRRSGRHGRVHELADPPSSPPSADHASVTHRPRVRGQHQPGAGLLPDRLVLRHPVRPHPAAGHHPRPPHHERHGQLPTDQHPDAADHGYRHRPEPLPALRRRPQPALTKAHGRRPAEPERFRAGVVRATGKHQHGRRLSTCGG